MREVSFQRNYTKHAGGSVLVAFGDTKVICTAINEEKVPPYREESGLGWLTGEYSMLPSSTHSRKRRPSGGKVDGRSMEISRLIGRSLRAAVNFEKLGPRTIWIDCDVIQADGGTRTASITGACVALYDCCKKLQDEGLIQEIPIDNFVAAISVGIVDGEFVTDLDYAKDSKAEVDMNVVGNEQGDFIEVQGTAENGVFSREQMNTMMDNAQAAIAELIQLQKKSLSLI